MIVWPHCECMIWMGVWVKDKVGLSIITFYVPRVQGIGGRIKYRQSEASDYHDIPIFYNNMAVAAGESSVSLSTLYPGNSGYKLYIL